MPLGIINLGSMAFPVVPLLLAAAVMVSVLVGKLSGAAHRRQIDSILTNVTIAGILAARLTFVITYWETYRQAPISMIDIRDGGFYPWAGLLVGGGLALWYVWCNVILRRRLLLSLLAGSCIAGLGGAAALMLRQPEADAGLPAATFTALNGSQVRFETFLGKPLVVNLWATWCPPCRREMPVLQQAQAYNTDVNFVFANQGETADVVRQYLAAEHLGLANVILDTRYDVAHHVGTSALPATLFFDSKGRLRSARMGQLSAATLTQQLESLRTATGDGS